MSLLSVDITKVKRLSLKEVKLLTAEVRVKPITPPIQVEKPPSDEDIIYSQLIEINPLIETLFKKFDLVSITGEAFKKGEVKKKPKKLEKDKIVAFTQRIVKGEDSYTKAEIIEKIKTATNVNQERAEKGFNLMLQAESIETLPNGRYYLTGSTPF